MAEGAVSFFFYGLTKKNWSDYEIWLDCCVYFNLNYVTFKTSYFYGDFRFLEFLPEVFDLIFVRVYRRKVSHGNYKDIEADF